jgi:hypothetical protein
MGEFLFTLSIILACVVCLLNLLMNTGEVTAYDTVGPTTWPVILASLIIVLLVVHLVKLAEKNGGLHFEEKLVFSAKTFLTHKMFLLTALIAVYIAGLNMIGFIICTPVLIYLAMSIIGQKNVKVKIICCIAIMIILFILFNKILGVPLPRGYGIFRTMAIAVERL